VSRVVLDGFLDAAECRRLVEIHRRFSVVDSNYHVVRTSRVATARELCSANAAERGLVASVRERVRRAVLEQLRAEEPLYVNMTQLSSMGSGGVVPLHADDCMLHLDTGRWVPTFFFRKYSALVYLDQSGRDYQGGVLEFVDAQGGARMRVRVLERVVPRRGTVVLFSSGRDNAHRTTPVTRGRRHVMAIWFCADERFAEPRRGHRRPPAVASETP
jgi:predicted 2-oxoglutarate/Fe(II)-dependent dioxygenase YbiX